MFEQAVAALVIDAETAARENGASGGEVARHAHMRLDDSPRAVLDRHDGVSVLHSLDGDTLSAVVVEAARRVEAGII